MKRTLPWTVILAATAIWLGGCGGGSSDKPATQEPPAVTKKTPESDPGRNIGTEFLAEQAAKRSRVEKTIKSFWADKSADPQVVRRMILNRKGELLTTKRNIRNSTLFTDAEKDSLVAPLDEESMNLSKELLAFSDSE